MKSKIALGLLSLGYIFNQAHADSNYDVNGVISETQLHTVLSTLLRIAPSGTKATDLDLKGFFTINDKRYLTVVDINAVQFKVTTKIGIIPVNSNVTISMAAAFPDLDCNHPQITRVSVAGTSMLLDPAIRSHIKKNAESLMRENFIGQTDLVKYCKIKPEVQ